MIQIKVARHRAPSARAFVFYFATIILQRSRIDQNLTHDLTTLLATLINNGSVRKMYVLAPHQRAPHIHGKIVWESNSHLCWEIYLRTHFF
jgi:hypothetical protein